jgi:hypothetical protein
LEDLVILSNQLHLIRIEREQYWKPQIPPRNPSYNVSIPHSSPPDSHGFSIPTEGILISPARPSFKVLPKTYSKHNPLPSQPQIYTKTSSQAIIDNFTLATWILQSAFYMLLSHRLSITSLLPFIILSYRIARVYLIQAGLLHNLYMDDIIPKTRP